MPVTLQQVFVANKQLIKSADAVNGTTFGPTFQMSNEFPIGDYNYDHLNFRFYGNITTPTGGGAVNPDGILQLLRSIQFSTPLHGNIVENLDGILLADIMHIKNRWRLPRIDPANTLAGQSSKFEAYLRVPFCDSEAFVLRETGLDVLRCGKPQLTIFLGAYASDMVVGGAAADGVQALNLETDVMMDPGPVDGADVPAEFMPYYGKVAFPITASGTQVRYDLAFGGTVYKKLYITQREGTNGIRRPNDIIGVSETDRVTLKVNSNIIYRDRLAWGALQRKNEFDFRLNAMPVGVAVYDFFQRVLGGRDSASGQKGGCAGAKIVDALNVATSQQGSIELDADVTAGNSPNPYIVVGYEGVKFIPPGARRPAPQAATAAKA